MQTEEQKQNWLEQRKKIVGASEISSVIKAGDFTIEELEKAMGGSAEEFLKDKLFTTPFALFNYKTGMAEREPFPISLREFGHEMEKFAVMFVNKKYSDILKAENKPQKVINCLKLHKLAGYTPDSFIEFTHKTDFLNRKEKDGKEIKYGEKAVFEIKTNNLFQFTKDNAGVMEGQEEVKFQYILQNQYQLWIQNKIDPSFKYGIIGCILAKDFSLDDNYYKGKAVAWCQDLNHINYKKLLENYSINLWIYPIYKSLHKLFDETLNRWQKRLDTNNEPTPDSESNKDIDIQKNRLKKRFDEMKVLAQKKYGACSKGIIKMTPELQEKYQNLSDTLKLDKENREDATSAKKAVEKTKAEFINICLEENILGFDFETFTTHLSKSKNGAITFRNNFKTSGETLKGKVKVNNDF